MSEGGVGDGAGRAARGGDGGVGADEGACAQAGREEALMAGVGDGDERGIIEQEETGERGRVQASERA